jgi:hypothetical protein
MMKVLPVRCVRAFAWLLALVATGALAQADPPSRVGTLSHLEGSVAFAPPGETNWSDAALNRPITRGDRLWTDEGARAEMHLGSAVLHLDSRAFIEVVALDQAVLRASVNEGSVNARVRSLTRGEAFELDTPQLALHAAQPGDFRIDVDLSHGFTRVTVHSGLVVVQGASGPGLPLSAGQQMAFRGVNLNAVGGIPAPIEDMFDRWTGDRNRAEDQSASAQHLSRDMVGYAELDRHGVWSQDAVYGTVWYPSGTAADWAPYRYGQWDWVAPWGWTWIDDAPWGFAPFHYGRWALIGSRWAWVPGATAPRPTYAPALVAFVGAGPGIGWYPLAPGEAWQPPFHASSTYVRTVNRSPGRGEIRETPQAFRNRDHAVTSMRLDEFRRGGPVQGRESGARPSDLVHAPFVVPPAALAGTHPGAPRPTAPSRPAAPQKQQRRDDRAV